MSGSAWAAPLARGGLWLGLFLALAVVRQQFERWLVARFQRQSQNRGARSAALPPGSRWAHRAALAAGFLAGAAIPLAPDVQIGILRVPVHILGGSDVALLYILAMDWLTAGLLAFARRTPYRLVREEGAWKVVGSLVLDMLPSSLIVLSLAIAASALDARHEGSLSLATLVDLQGSGPGLRWLGIHQPFAMLLWVICATPFRTPYRARKTMAWQIQALNRALLVSTVFLGGWQGPYAEGQPWLGLLYTTIKAGAVTFAWVWARASSPAPALSERASVVWRVLVPIAALNLLITALAVAL